MVKKLILITTLGYTILLTTLSLIHLKEMPSLGVSFTDKVYHFLAYFILTIFWFASFFYTFSMSKKRSILFALILAVVFGIIIEVLQGTLTKTRALDVYDMMANTIGAFLACIIISFMGNLQVKNQ